MKTIVVIGKSGQLAWELSKLPGANIVTMGRNDVDLFDEHALHAALLGAKPDAIINASAYTAVDNAESDPDAAYALNEYAVANLAKYCEQVGAFLVHVSTDYVFNGEKGSPYTIDDPIAPQGVYGASKAAGEKAILASIADRSCILRTSWVYSSHGNNFVKTMLRLMADKPKLTVIDDQVGTPTWAAGLAKACIEAAMEEHSGVFHWSDEGVTTWYDFAIAIQKLGIEKGMLGREIPILPIPTRDYPTPAKRPHYSVLDKSLTRQTFSTPGQHWQAQLSAMLDELGE